MVAKHHEVTNICTLGKRWLFSFSRAEKTSGTSKQDEGIQVSQGTLLLPWSSRSNSSKADMAAPHSTLSSTACLPSRDSQHTDLGCHHLSGCCSVPAAVKQARRCSYTSMGVCGHTLHASLPGCLEKVSGLADSWSAKPAHIFMQSWSLSAALCIFFYPLFPWQTSCLPMPLCFIFSLIHHYFPLKKRKNKQKSMLEIIFCDSPLGSGIARNQYDPNFIVNLGKHPVKKSMLHKIIIFFYH